MGKKVVIEGSMAIAEAVKQARPHVISAYPITPQTHIMEFLAEMVANGELDAEYLRVDSEFSAASVAQGASGAGSRAYTASASQGLLLMTEVLYNIAGMRLPVVLTGVNRSVGTPVNIQPDHQDTILFRDTGMIQLYVEDAQDAYDTHLQAFKIAEDRDVLLPVLVAVDGWTISHTFEPVELEDQAKVDAFLPPYKPLYHLDPKQPFSFGNISIDKDLMEFRYLHEEAMQGAKAKIEAVAREFEQAFGRFYGGLIQTYKTEDADIVLVAMGSIVGTLKEAVDKMRAAGKKVGVLKIRSYRPFPEAEVRKALANAKVACVMDRAISIGFGGPLTIDVKAALYGPQAPQVLPFFAGLGGKDVEIKHVEETVAKAEAAAAGDKVPTGPEFVNINWNLVS